MIDVGLEKSQQAIDASRFYGYQGPDANVAISQGFGIDFDGVIRDVKTYGRRQELENISTFGLGPKPLPPFITHQIAHNGILYANIGGIPMKYYT